MSKELLTELCEQGGVMEWLDMHVPRLRDRCDAFMDGQNGKTEERYEFSTAEDKDKMEILMDEVLETMQMRADTVFITVTRTNEFPKHRGKELIQNVEISMLDSAA